MTDDTIEQLRERIRSTAAAADRLAADFAAGEGTPDEGWQTPSSDEATREAQALVALVHLLRDLLPPELRQQVLDLLRQVLLLLRAIIDRFVTSLEPVAPGEPPVVQDIPVD